MLLKMGRGKVDFHRGLTRLASYARHHGHANPKASETWLTWRVGLWVSQLRVKYRSDKLTDEQIAEAEAIGVKFAPPYQEPRPKPQTGAQRKEIEYLRRIDSLNNFYLEHGHINVRQVHGTNEWPGAGRWIARLRSQYRHGTLPQTVIDAAEKMNIAWNPGPGSRSE